MLNKEENRIVDQAEKAYIKILGKKKWNSLTDPRSSSMPTVPSTAKSTTRDSSGT